MEETEKLSLEVTPITTTLAQGINKHKKLGTVSFFVVLKVLSAFWSTMPLPHLVNLVHNQPYI